MVLNSILSSPRAMVLEQALAASSLRQKVISNNIANVNTPGYKKSEVSFEDMLQSAMSNDKLQMTQTNPKHLPLGQRGMSVPTPQVHIITNTSTRTDGSNVDIDIEMANLAKNSIYYDAVAQQLGSYFSGIKSAIREGR